MAKFILSAFSDEYSKDFDEQIEGLKKHGITHMEIRGLFGKSIGQLTDEELATVKKKLADAGIGISAIGSGLGKIKVTDDFEPHLEQTKRVVEIAKYLGTRNIRMFSFYCDGAYEESRTEVMRRLGLMLEIAEKENIFLCHENEKGIYGDTVERCLDIQNTFEGRIKCIFDPANFVQSGETTYPDAYERLKDKIYYMHIKDAESEDGMAVPAGEGLGHIPEILSKLKKREQTYFLTLEPHLHGFEGLAALEADEKTKISTAYATSEEAFGVGADALKGILMKL